jgi:hypothetical protein
VTGRSVAVFFYGLFMDADLLRSKGVQPTETRKGIGPQRRATDRAASGTDRFARQPRVRRPHGLAGTTSSRSCTPTRASARTSQNSSSRSWRKERQSLHVSTYRMRLTRTSGTRTTPASSATIVNFSAA